MMDSRVYCTYPFIFQKPMLSYAATSRPYPLPVGSHPFLIFFSTVLSNKSVMYSLLLDSPMLPKNQITLSLTFDAVR